MQLPRLLPVPSTFHDLTIKATATGIIYLTQRRFKVRYTGSKKSAVDINGNLHLSAIELQKQLKLEREGQKKGGKRKNAPPKNLLMQAQTSEQSTEKPKKERRKFSYTINKKEVRQRIYGYINTQKGKKELYFWTVSFPEHTPDDVAYQAFNTWLTSLRKYRMLKDYLWVAERQDGKRTANGVGTGTVHFHIAVPHKMDVHRANAMMRGTLKTFAKRGEIPYNIHQQQIKKYNGVDLCKNRKTRRVVNFAIKKGQRALSHYLTKYVTKNNAGGTDENGNEVPGFTHLAWHNSRGFSVLFTGITFTVAEFIRAGFGPFLNRVRVFDMRYCKFIPWLFGPPPLIVDHLSELNSYIQYATENP